MNEDKPLITPSPVLCHSGERAYFVKLHPEYATTCDWEKFSSNDWVWMLMHNPRYALICAWDDMSDDGIGWMEYHAKFHHAKAHLKPIMDEFLK
jgi:hypothetical protein